MFDHLIANLIYPDCSNQSDSNQDDPKPAPLSLSLDKEQEPEKLEIEKPSGSVLSLEKSKEPLKSQLYGTNINPITDNDDNDNKESDKPSDKPSQNQPSNSKSANAYNMDSVFNFSIAQEMGSIKQSVDLQNISNQDLELSALYKIGDDNFQAKKPNNEINNESNNESLKQPEEKDSQQNNQNSEIRSEISNISDQQDNSAAAKVEFNEFTINDFAEFLGKKNETSPTNNKAINPEKSLQNSSLLNPLSASIEDQASVLLEEIPDIKESDFVSEEFTDKVTPLKNQQDDHQDLNIKQENNEEIQLSKIFNEQKNSSDMMNSQNFNLSHDSLMSEAVGNKNTEEQANLLGDDFLELDSKTNDEESNNNSPSDQTSSSKIENLANDKNIYQQGDDPSLKVNSEYNKFHNLSEKAKSSLTSKVTQFKSTFGKTNAKDNDLVKYAFFLILLAMAAIAITQTPLKNILADKLVELKKSQKSSSEVAESKPNEDRDDNDNNLQTKDQKNKDDQDQDSTKDTDKDYAKSDIDSDSDKFDQTEELDDNSYKDKQPGSGQTEIYFSLDKDRKKSFDQSLYPKPSFKLTSQQFISKLESPTLWHHYQVIKYIRKFGIIDRVDVLNQIIEKNQKLWLSLEAVACLYEFNEKVTSSKLQHVIYDHNITLLNNWVMKQRSARKLKRGEAIVLRTLLNIAEGETRYRILVTLSKHPDRLNYLYLLNAIQDPYPKISSFSEKHSKTIPRSEKIYLKDVLDKKQQLEFDDNKKPTIADQA